MFFYIKGHTKILCNRRFNIFKRYYRVYNIYRFDNMIAKFRTHDLIKVHTLKEGDFRDWEFLLELLYKRIVGILTNHLFYATDEEPKMLFSKVDNVIPSLPFERLQIFRVEGNTQVADKLEGGDRQGIEFARFEVE